MRMKVFWLLLFCILAALSAHADVWGHAWVSYDEQSGTVIGTCETDSGLNEYYLPIVECFLYNNNNYDNVYDRQEGYFGSGGSIWTEVELPLVPGQQYTVEARNAVESTFFNGINYLDPYDYTIWTFQNVYWPSWFDYYGGPDPTASAPNTEIDMGTVYDTFTVPGLITLSDVRVDRPSISGAQCATGTAQVAVSRGTIAANPTVTVTMSVFFAVPPEVTVNITPVDPPTSVKLITGDTAAYTFSICHQDGTGTVHLTAYISDYSPSDNFTKKDFDGSKGPTLTIN